MKGMTNLYKDKAQKCIILFLLAYFVSGKQRWIPVSAKVCLVHDGSEALQTVRRLYFFSLVPGNGKTIGGLLLAYLSHSDGKNKVVYVAINQLLKGRYKRRLL